MLYPTGGKSTYSYGNSPVGTDVKTYYVTLRNLYSSSTAISLTSSISYSLVNGNVVWSNSTISDGTNVQAYSNINFLGSSTREYDENATGALVRVAENDFDSKGRINETKLISPSSVVLAYSTMSYDSWGNLKYSKDNVGHETWFSYANTDSSSSFGSAGCSTSFYTQTISSNIHDALVGQCSYQNGAGSAQMQTYYKYDTNGNLLEQKVLHNGGWLYTDYTYDSYGNMLSSTDALGHTTYFRYSSAYSSAYLTKQSILVGTQNVTTTYTYDSAKGFLLSQTDPSGYTTSYQYDALGRPTSITYPPVGGVYYSKSYSYNDAGNIFTATDENGNVTKSYFDGLGRQTKVERWNGSSVYSAETYTYNWLNLVATKTTAAGNTYSYTYDSFGRQTKLTNPDSTCQTTAYDDVNNVKTMTDENGHKTVYAYDWNDRLTSVKEYNSSSTYYLTTYGYDLTGNLRSVTDAKSQVTAYQYDDLNRLTQTTYPDSTTESRTYDSVGNMLSKTDPKDNTIHYAYDALNRLTTVTYPDSSTMTYTYDADSNVKSAINPSASDYYTYDPRGRLTNQTEVVGSKYSLLYTYDGVGNVVSIKYPDSYLLSLGYDQMNRLTTVGSFATIAYTVDDQVSKIAYGDGEVQTYTYDSRDRPERILDKYGSTTEMDLNYTYDGTGNVLTLNSETYSYDWLDRLTSTTGPWGTITYTYDQVGNRVKMVQGGVTTNYIYGSYNRLNSAGNINYTYDANGNTVTKNDGSSWTYGYDYENRLTSVTHSGIAVQRNFYDAGGNRVEKTETNTTVYAYQGLNILYEKDLNSSLVTKHFYANGLQVTKMTGSSVYYFHADHLGSTRIVMSSSLAIVYSSNYVPFGPNSGNSGSEVFTYTDKPYDSMTGLYYFGARFYDPTVGRFVTEDSYAGIQADPQSLNRYAYARDNPMRFVDPNGHSSRVAGDLTRLIGDVTTMTLDYATLNWDSLWVWLTGINPVLNDLKQLGKDAARTLKDSARLELDLGLAGAKMIYKVDMMVANGMTSVVNNLIRGYHNADLDWNGPLGAISILIAGVMTSTGAALATAYGTCGPWTKVCGAITFEDAYGTMYVFTYMTSHPSGTTAAEAGAAYLDGVEHGFITCIQRAVCLP